MSVFSSAVQRESKRVEDREKQIEAKRKRGKQWRCCLRGDSSPLASTEKSRKEAARACVCVLMCVCGPGHSVQGKSILHSSPHLNDTLREKQINSPGKTVFHRFCFVNHRVGWSENAPLQGATRQLNQRAALWEWSSWLLKTPTCVCRGA